MEPTLRVIQSAPTWLPRTQTWMYQHARLLPDRVESHIVCDRTENLDQFRLPAIHALADRPWPVRVWDKALRAAGLRRHPGLLVRVARRIGARVIHSHFGHVGWRDRPAAARSGARHVVTFYGQDLGYLPREQPHWKERYRDMFSGVDRVLCEGPCMARGVVDLGCPEERVQVQPLGVDLEALAFRPREWDGKSPLRVLMAGSFTEKKGFPDGIEALGLVAEFADLEVTLVGDADDKPRNKEEKRRILAKLEKSGVRHRLLGYRTHAELLDEVNGHHVLLAPSRTAHDGDTEGGAPVTIIEAAATGMPVVSTLHADIPQVLPDGLLAREGNRQELARHLLFLAEHPDEWESLARRMRRHLEAEYDVRRQAERLATVYEEVAGG